MDSHGISHALAVQPSGYGCNNAALLDSIRQSMGRLKGIAVVPPDLGEDELHQLKNAGVVGVRFNLVDCEPASLSENGVENLNTAKQWPVWNAGFPMRISVTWFCGIRRPGHCLPKNTTCTEMQRF